LAILGTTCLCGRRPFSGRGNGGFGVAVHAPNLLVDDPRKPGHARSL